MQLLISALLLLAAAQLCCAGNYDAYIQALEKRNLQMHDQYLGQLQSGQPSFLDELEARVAGLQEKHFVQDSQYPQDFDSGKYWNELLGSNAAAADSEAELDAEEAPPSDRREEEPFMNKVWGSQKVSGGAGKSGGQVTGPLNQPQAQQVKTDRLPSYCNPPNPCPKHGDAKKLGSPCDANVKDSAEFNYADALRKMADGQCPCDTEHMHCPRSLGATDAHKKMNPSPSNPYLLGNKRDKHDAKKSPRLAVAKRGVKAHFRSNVVEKKNPWLDGSDTVETVEKKDGRHRYDEQQMEAE